jgi:hypothetical protein
MKLLAYNIIQQQYTTQEEVSVNEGCNAVTVRNIGDDVLFFNGIPLQPPPGVGLSGESVAFEGNFGEVYTGRIQIQFAGVGINPRAEVTQKFYIENNY